MSLQFQQQQQIATPVDDPVLLAEADGLEIVEFESYDSELIDVRAFNSFYFIAEVEPDPGNTDSQWDISLRFYAEPTTSNNAIVFEDEYRLFQSNVNNFRLTDQMHGGWARILINDSNSAPYSMFLDLKFFGSYREMPNAYLRTAPDGVLYDAVSANTPPGTDDGGDFAALGYGETQIVLTGEDDSARIEVYTDGAGGTATYRFDTSAAGERGTWRVMLPKQQVWVVLTNTGAVDNTIRARIYAPPQPY
jgi:hypothetical protein